MSLILPSMLLQKGRPKQTGKDREEVEGKATATTENLKLAIYRSEACVVVWTFANQGQKENLRLA